MKFKLFNWLIVSLVTVAILYPALLVLSIVWQEHLQIVLGKQNYIAKPVHWFLFLIPILLELVIVGYNSYIIYQTHVLYKQVKRLERMWHES
jgi:hypothetical protein